METTIEGRLNLVKTAKKLTFKELGEALGVSDDMAKNYLTGRTTISSDKLIILCKTYNISSDWMIFGEGPMSRQDEMDRLQKLDGPQVNLGSLRESYDLIANMWMDLNEAQSKINDLEDAVFKKKLKPH